jgi:hypothetical protein
MKEEELTSIDNLLNVLSTNDNLLYFTNDFTISHFSDRENYANTTINEKLKHNKLNKLAKFLTSKFLTEDKNQNIVAKFDMNNLKLFINKKSMEHYKQVDGAMLDQLLQKYCPQQNASKLSASIIEQMDNILNIIENSPFLRAGICKEITVTNEAPKTMNIAKLSKELIYYIASFLTFEEWGMSQVKANNTETSPPLDQSTQVDNLGEHLDVIPS